MAEQRQLEEIAVANFDLLGPNDDLYEVNLEDELTEEHREAVQNMFNEITEKELGEKADSMDDFEPDVSTSRHVNCSSADLDNYSDANSKDTTKKQTKWAVSIFLGKYTLFSQINPPFLEKKCCSRRQISIQCRPHNVTS